MDELLGVTGEEEAGVTEAGPRLGSSLSATVVSSSISEPSPSITCGTVEGVVVVVVVVEVVDVVVVVVVVVVVLGGGVVGAVVVLLVVRVGKIRMGGRVAVNQGGRGLGVVVVVEVAAREGGERALAHTPPHLVKYTHTLQVINAGTKGRLRLSWKGKHDTKKPFHAKLN